MTREEAKKIAQGLITDFKCDSDTMVDFCNTVIKALNQTSWIPVSERLPEKEGKYLVTTYSCGTYEVVTSWFFIWNDGEIEWGEYGVVAWMPRIEPYVPNKNDGDIEESEGKE